MFDQMKAMGALTGLLRNQDRLREAGEELKARLDQARIHGEAGGGAVRVTVSGSLKVTDVTIDSSLLAAGEADKGAAEALIAEATNHALEQARNFAQQEVAKLARDLGLPEIPGLQSMLTG